MADDARPVGADTGAWRRDKVAVLQWLCLAMAAGLGGLATLLWATLSSQVASNSKDIGEQRVHIRELQIYRDTNRDALERIERYVTALAAKQGVTLPP